MAFSTAMVVLVPASGALLAWVVSLRRRLRESQSGAAANRSAGREEIAALRERQGTLSKQNRVLQTRLDEAHQELAALSYSISHDLRAPLRSVSGFSQALAEDHGPRLDSNAQDYLRRVRAGALHMNALIDELLALSRILRAPCQVGPVDLSALARKIAGELSASEPGRRVQWNISPGVTARGDAALLTTALRHLLGNAWKFSVGRPVAHIGFRAVELDAASPEAGVAYEVRDNGVGFDTRYAGKLFGVFQHMHAAGEFPGQGVGLATVQRIVRRHGGRIWAAAEPEQGAVFSFTLDPDAAPGSARETAGSTLVQAATPLIDAVEAPQPKPSVV